MLNKLGKLLKYEFRFYARILPPTYLVLVLIAFVARFQMPLSDTDVPILLIVWTGLIVAMLVINAIQIIQRFTDNFMKNPGALMFTLPVTVWALTASKAIAAFCTILASLFSILLSGLIYGIGKAGFQFDVMLPKTLNDMIYFILFVLFIVFMVFQQLCLLYTAITASHILPKFRVVAGCAIYFVVLFFVERIFEFADVYANVFSGAFISQIFAVVMALAFAVLFFWSTGLLLKRSYNLE